MLTQQRAPVFASLLLGAAIFLFAASFWTQSGDREITPPQEVASQENPLIPGYDYPTLGIADFLERAAVVRSELRELQNHDQNAGSSRPVAFLTSRLDPHRSLAELNDLVFQTIRHSDQLEIRWTDNFIQKSLAYLYPPLREPQLPWQILQQQQGLCSDSCKILQWQLQQAGIDSAFLGLGQHVVLLVHHQGRYYWADPDFGIVVTYDPTTGRPDEFQLIEQGRHRGFSEPTLRRLREILADRTDWTRLAWNQPLSPRLTLVAKISELTVQFAPLFLLAGGLATIWHCRNDWNLERKGLTKPVR